MPWWSRVEWALCSVVWCVVGYAMVGWEIRSSAWRCHCLQLMPLLLLVFSSLCLLSYLCFRFAHVFSMVRAVWRNMLPLLSVCVLSLCVCVCVSVFAC